MALVKYAINNSYPMYIYNYQISFGGFLCSVFFYHIDTLAFKTVHILFIATRLPNADRKCRDRAILAKESNNIMIIWQTNISFMLIINNTQKQRCPNEQWYVYCKRIKGFFFFVMINFIFVISTQMQTLIPTTLGQKKINCITVTS